MCGIAGWFDPEALSRAGSPEALDRRLAAMCDAIRHRGPDDHGAWIDGPVGLGMRRLSIVDIAHGHQPMATPDGRWRLVFNGEIYNHVQLRGEGGGGGAFATRSDTEVLLRLMSEHGPAALHKLNGMFGFALWDEREKRLILARDRMGVKPLYYYWDGVRLLFGSEIKAILAGLDTRPEVNARAIWDYLTLRYVPAPETIWKHIHKLPPGHLLMISADAPTPRIERWWDMPRPDSAHADDDSLAMGFERLLTDAVDLRMLADVPVGITLSGGLDSSVVAALAARNGARVKTFSVAFDGAAALDERPYARQVAQAIGAEHREIVVDENMFRDFLPDFVHYTDEPLADLASIPLHYVCRLAREDVKVVLSGEGADEILGGYSFDRWAQRWDGAAANAARGGDVDPADLDLRKALEPISMTNALTSSAKSAMMRGAAYPDTLDTARTELAAFGEASPLAQALYLYCQDWLVEDLLMKADKMSMATSLELRTPFLDYRMVEFAAQLPDHLRVGPNQSGVYETKKILRDLGRRLLPPAIAARPKMGFPVPVYGWLSGSLKPLAYDLLGSDCKLRAWIDPAAIAETLALGVQVNGDNANQHRLWHLMILELWLRRWT